MLATKNMFTFLEDKKRVGEAVAFQTTARV